ncbi:MAG TPA: LysM peptidoglycan-binding domain-containing protein [Polyangiaceae bacterium]|nr:LysM peptidoglycan-binding domain-containing protein [Polyangiaceae bacterium]
MSLRTLLLCSLFLLTAPALAQEGAAGSARGRALEPEVTEHGLVYRVVQGDTLSQIAERLEVPVADLLAMNEGLEADRLSVGQELRINSGLRRVRHVVRAGEALSRIAARYEVRVADLLRWNRGLRRDVVREGRGLVVFTAVPTSRSRSVGRPYAGSLVAAAQLPPRHPAYVLRTPSRAYGTDETVRWLVDGLAHVRAEVRHTPRVEVHDLSRRRGGALMGHRSHRSGRDADVAYYRRGCGAACDFRTITAAQLDVARQWALFHHWLEQGRVEAIFVDHSLQRALYEYARSQGVDRRQLSRWFQYPRAVENRHGVIRHHPRHANHFHVRFVCPDTDEECR